MKPVAIWNCTRKRRYESEAEADKQAEYLINTKDAHVDTYKCNICEGWHLTSMRSL